MKKIKAIFNTVVENLQTEIDWSETDGSDVRKVLTGAFMKYQNYKSELIRMFEEISVLNKFQKMMITEILFKEF